MANAVIRLRRDTAADWTAGNPVLALGEPGVETDTGQVKYGDGTTAWNSLSYAGSLADDSVTNAKLADMANARIKGRATAGSGDPEDLTATQVRTILNVADGATANSADATLLARANHTGTQAASTITGLATVATTGAYSDLSGLPTLFDGAWVSLTGIPAVISGTTASFTTAQETKLAGIATGATANTGTVTSVGGAGTVNGLTLTGAVTTTGSLTLGGTLSATASNISDFSEAVDDRVATLLVAGTNITLTYDDGAGTLTIDASGGGGITDGNKGDITVSASGATWTIDNDAVTFAKTQNISQDRLLGRFTAGSGDIEEVSLDGSLLFSGGSLIVNTNYVRNNSTSTDNAIARFDLATGKLIQNSAATVSDDGVLRSATNTGANAVSVPLVNWLMQTANYTLTSTTAEQKAFNTTTNGLLTLPTGVYYYECWLYVTGLSATSGNLGFSPLGGGTAVVDRGGYSSYGTDNTVPTSPITLSGRSGAAVNAPGPVVGATVGTGMQVRISGMFRVTTAGTIIPSVTLSTAAAAAVNAGSWFRIDKLGESSETSVGDWS